MAQTRPSPPSSRRKYLALAARAQELLNQRNDPSSWIESNLFLRDKDRRVIPFLFNWAQEEYYQHRTPRVLICKPRQMGFATEICGLFSADTILRPSTTSVMVTHELDSASRIFRIVQLFWEGAPRVPCPAKDGVRAGDGGETPEGHDGVLGRRPFLACLTSVACRCLATDSIAARC